MALTPLSYAPREYALIVGEYIPEAEKLISRGLRPYIYDFKITKAVSATAVEFISAGINTAINVQNAGSPTKVAVISTDIGDATSATGHVRQTKIWSIDSNNNFNIIAGNPSGTSSASAATAVFEVNNVYASLYGSGGQDMAGSFKVSMIGKTSKAALDITSGQNVSLSSRVWAPKNWYGKILSINARFVTQVVSGDQAEIFPQYYDKNANQDFDGSHDSVGFAVGGAQFGSNAFPRTYGNSTTIWKVSFFGKATNTETLGIAVRMLLWADAPALATGQFKYIIGA